MSVDVRRGAFTGFIRLYVDGKNVELTPKEAVDLARELLEVAIYG